MLDNWETIPLVSLKVIDGKQHCPEDHPEEVIYRRSPDIKETCTCKIVVYEDKNGNQSIEKDWAYYKRVVLD